MQVVPQTLSSATTPAQTRDEFESTLIVSLQELFGIEAPQPSSEVRRINAEQRRSIQEQFERFRTQRAALRAVMGRRRFK